MTDQGTSRVRPLIVLVLGALAIAFSPILVRLSTTGPAAAGFWRLALALPLLTVVAVLARPKASGGKGWAPPPLTLLAGLFFALDLGFWHYGIRFTTVANATILANLSPVIVTLGAWLILRERPGRRFIAGLALAVAGTWLIAAFGRRGGALDPALGDGLSLATAVWYAAYMLTVRAARQATSAARVMAWSSLFGAPLLLAAAFGLGEQILPTSQAGWLACAGLGLVHVVGQGAIAWALGRLPAALASVVILAQPVLSAVLGWIIFGEAMAALQIAGAGLALAGVALAQLSPRTLVISRER